MLKEYLKDNQKNILIMMCTVLVVYSFIFVTNIISIDTELLITNPDALLMSWYSLGRFGLCYFKKFFHLLPINLFWSNIVTMILFMIGIILWVYVFARLRKQKNTKADLLFMLILAGSPVFAEQFCFTLQSVEISLAFVLEAVAMILVSRFVERSEVISAIIAVGLLIICFSFYQAFVVLYILACLMIYLLQDCTKEEDLKAVAKYISILLISFFITSVLSHFAKENMGILGNNAYLGNQMMWGTEPLLKTILRVCAYIFLTLMGLYCSYHPFVLVIYPVFVKAYVAHHKNFYWLHGLSLIALMVIPFLLSIVSGSNVPFRSQFCIPFLLGFGIWYLYGNGVLKKWLRCVIGAVVILQCSATFLLHVSAWNCYRLEVNTAAMIQEQLTESDKPLIFLGSYNPNPLLKGETLGHSFFEWDDEVPVAQNHRIHDFLLTQGVVYVAPSANQIEEARIQAENLTYWEDLPVVHETGQYRIVRFHENLGIVEKIKSFF